MSSEAAGDALKLAKRIVALGGGDVVRRKAALRELTRLTPEQGLEMLDALITESRRGDVLAQKALLAFLAAFKLEPEAAHVIWKIRALADVRAMDAVKSLFEDAAAKSEYQPEAARRADARSFSQSLGHLKTQARLTRDMDELMKLLAASEADVVRNALLNPRLTEAHVVRLAAKRPARPEPLAEVWASRWGARHAVRRALAFNPYLPPGIGSKIVPTLTTVDLRELTRDMAVHGTLRLQAQLLLEPELKG